jgi:hypothetical protein
MYRHILSILFKKFVPANVAWPPPSIEERLIGINSISLLLNRVFSLKKIDEIQDPHRYPLNETRESEDTVFSMIPSRNGCLSTSRSADRVARFVRRAENRMRGHFQKEKKKRAQL